MSQEFPDLHELAALIATMSGEIEKGSPQVADALAIVIKRTGEATTEVLASRYKSLTHAGMSPEQAISVMINRTADVNKAITQLASKKK